ncbi:hypothetical protein DFH06DRAFT_676237 [Mycena polygramma]|nr:hypothetical protein DFH06DRAFT_676237 [Mycena polygramma]
MDSESFIESNLESAPSGRLWWNARGPGFHAKKANNVEWVDCAKATRSFDKDMVGSLRGDMDTLLVFASLFSAVVTAFVIQSYPRLNGASSADTSAMLLRQLLLHAQGGSTGIDATASAPLASGVSASSVWINGLWFFSLVLSLNTVLGAILAKQWLSEYELVTCSTTSISPREQVALRQSTFGSLGRWKVTTIVNYLPVQLICALLLFFAGLVYLVWTLDTTVAIITSILVAFSVIFFLGTSFLPTFFELCAFRSPQAWLCFYLSKRLLQILHQSANCQLFSFTDTWIDLLSDVLSRPAATRTNEVRGLCWIHATLAPWELTLFPSLCGCATTLSLSDMVNVISDFWRGGSSPSPESVLHTRSLVSTIGPEGYWKLYADLLHSIPSKTGADDSRGIVFFCSLHLILCGERQRIILRPPVILLGLIHLAKILSQNLISHDTEMTLTAILSYISGQETLSLPHIDTAALGSLELLTTEVSRLESRPGFPALSGICIRLQSEIWDSSRLRRAIDWAPLSGLLHTMRSAMQNKQLDVNAAIAQWMSCGLEAHSFIRLVIDSGGNDDVLNALQELAQCFRKAHDDGVGLSADVVQLVDILIVRMCSPEVICPTISRATYGGGPDPLSERNLKWWASQLRNDKDTVFLRLCDHLPPAYLPSNPQSWQIACLRIVFAAPHSWFPHSSSEYSDNNRESSQMTLRTLPVVVAACLLSEPELAQWFPGITSPKAFLVGEFDKYVATMVANNFTFPEPTIPRRTVDPSEYHAMCRPQSPSDCG